jgi:hypothetical protein
MPTDADGLRVLDFSHHARRRTATLAFGDMSPTKGEPRSSADERWTQEAVRLYRRYQHEVVEACGLCPWAARVRLDGRVRERVLTQRDDGSVEPSLFAIAALASASVDVALLIYPRLILGRAAFEQFAGRVREADVRRWPLGEAPFVCAVFHPEAGPDMTEPERLIPFLRRTPDPTLQFLRTSVLDRVRSPTGQGTQFVDPALVNTLTTPTPPLREQIARANHATTVRLGVEAMTRRLDDIAEDRALTYRFLETGAA